MIHASPLRLVIAVTGGGSLAISDLLTEPGASQTVLEAGVPYGEAALCEFLSHKPEQFCSEKTARQMAMATFVRAIRFSQTNAASSQPTTLPDRNLIGIGCTCALSANRPKRGEHRIHWAVQSVDQTLALSIGLEKGGRTRSEEERLVADVLTMTVAAYAEGRHPGEGNRNLFSDDRLDVLSRSLRTRLRDTESLTIRSVRAPEDLQNLLFGNKTTCRILPRHWPGALLKSQQSELPPETPGEMPQFLFPGSFDPMHCGHRKMLEIAREKFDLSGQMALELAVQNVDKPPSDYIDINDRVRSIVQTAGVSDIPIWLTQLPRFTDKSDVFRGVTFIIGTDTLKRVALPQYYHDAIDSPDAAIDRLIENRCRFLCFARKNSQGETETDKSVPLPENLRQIVDFISPEEFCDDISSTQLRQQLHK